MYSSTYRFTLDLHSTVSQISLPVTIGDTNRAFNIRLADGGLPYTIEDGCVAMITIKRPGGTVLEEFCPIERNTLISYNFSQNSNTAAEEGIHICEIIIYDKNGEVLASPWFTMIVTERAAKKAVDISAEDYTAIDAMLAKEVERQTNESDRINAEEARDRDEDARKKAETARDEAESGRVTAESERENNEETRRQNEDERIGNENTRKENEKARNNGENLRNENYAKAEADRYNTFNSAEGQRDTEYGQYETARENSYASAETNRNNRYSQAERERDNAYRQAEARRDYKSTAGAYDALDERVTNIESYINPKYYITSAERVYERIIPSNACPFIELNEIGAHVETSNNLLNPELFGTHVNDDGWVYYPGNLSAPSASIKLPAGTYTVSSDSGYLHVDGGAEADDSNTSPITFTLSSEAYVLISLAGDFATWYDSFYTWVMLNKGETALPYEPFYVKGTKVTAIEHYGANLVDDVALFERQGWVKQDNGYYLGSNPAGIIGFENVEGRQGSMSISYMSKTLTANGSGNSVFLAMITYSDGTIEYKAMTTDTTKEYGLRTYTTPADKTVSTIKLSRGITGTFEIKDLIINWGGVAPYQPYSAEPIFTLNIPQSIQNLNGYGFGTIDFDNKKYIQDYDENGALSNPIVTDISSYLKNFDNTPEVQAGGTLRFINEAKAPILSTISYLAKEGTV